MNLHVHTAPLEGEAFHLSTGHRHAHEALVGLQQGLRDVCESYSHPFHLSHCLIQPRQRDVREAETHLMLGMQLLQRSLGMP